MRTGSECLDGRRGEPHPVGARANLGRDAPTARSRFHDPRLPSPASERSLCVSAAKGLCPTLDDASWLRDGTGHRERCDLRHGQGRNLGGRRARTRQLFGGTQGLSSGVDRRRPVRRFESVGRQRSGLRRRHRRSARLRSALITRRPHVPMGMPAVCFGARGGIRTPTILRSVDFESTVSAIPPPGRVGPCWHLESSGSGTMVPVGHPGGGTSSTCGS